MKPPSLIAVIFLGVVSVAHLLRLLLGVEAVVGGRLIPMWASLVAFVFTGALAVALWSEKRRRA